MKFGIFYEQQLPRPWGEGEEQRMFQEALDQVELADPLGIDYAWEVEHHFLDEYSHSSAPASSSCQSWPTTRFPSYSHTAATSWNAKAPTSSLAADPSRSRPKIRTLRHSVSMVDHSEERS
jgi:alkanesulfonate monooxygenase SsuD/methylene tetrahydromethanopterin reductase-like flavin-dependent oxidoreductase (luciferase family)